MQREGMKEIRIAVLGGTTTNELVDLLELFLLDSGFRPLIQQSEYARFYENAVFEPESIASFKPNIVYIHTCALNIQIFPSSSCSEAELHRLVESEIDRYRAIWSSLCNNTEAQIIQNNFELPEVAILGNLDIVSAGGATRFVHELNRQFASEAAANPRLILQDLNSLAARLGMERWFDHERWYSYKIANSVEGSVAITKSLNALIAAIYGRSRKVLVLDLDNTLWGGVIGEDGVNKIVLGQETPIAEAYTAFQKYCLSLHERGVLLAAASKNDEETAKEGFSHPDSVLKLEHFSAFKANWEPKHENILTIARELNLGVESFVFVDDNPAERAIVEAQIPGIAVPDVGSDVTRFAEIIEQNRYFESISIGREDFARARFYEENAQRRTLQQKFTDYGEFLDSLEMTAEIDVFHSGYIERISQLVNKSNQFNLTTRRYTLAEIETASKEPSCIGIYGKLADRFGDNGLVSAVMGSVRSLELHIHLWVMSCRVLKRELEVAMLDRLVELARNRDVTVLFGYYLPSAKNGIVAEHYQKLGFTCILKDETSGSSVWSLDIREYEPRSSHIRVLEATHE